MLGQIKVGQYFDIDFFDHRLLLENKGGSEFFGCCNIAALTRLVATAQHDNQNRAVLPELPLDTDSRDGALFSESAEPRSYGVAAGNLTDHARVIHPHRSA